MWEQSVRNLEFIKQLEIGYIYAFELTGFELQTIPTFYKESLGIGTKECYNSKGIQFHREGIELLLEKEKDMYFKGFNCEHSGQL